MVEEIRLTAADWHVLVSVLSLCSGWGVISFILLLVHGRRLEDCEIKLAVCERFLKWLETRENVVGGSCKEDEPIPVAEAVCDCGEPDVCSECKMNCCSGCRCWCHGSVDARD